jgi:hypothetical protein
MYHNAIYYKTCKVSDPGGFEIGLQELRCIEELMAPFLGTFLVFLETNPPVSRIFDFISPFIRCQAK